MFGAIIHDFDRRYWSRACVALLSAAAVGTSLGVGWLLAELLSRLSFFILQALFAWLFPPALGVALTPYEPVTFQLVTDAVHRSAVDEVITVDLDMGDVYVAEEPQVTQADLPPVPGEEPDLARLVESSGLLAILGSDEGNSFGNVGLIGVLGDSDVSSIFGDSLDSDLTGGIGGLIGAKGTQIGSGGLGSRGSGLGVVGGGTAEGLGGLGTIGTGRRSGYGRSSGGLGNHGSRGTGGTAVVGSVDTEGDAAALSAVVKRSRNAIQYCYQRELKKDPALEGKLVVAVSIGAGGRVESARAVSDTVGSKPVTNCILGRFRRMSFSGVEQADLQVPIRLSGG